MDKRIEPELPSITPDLDQVEAFKDSLNQTNNKLPASAATPSESKSVTNQKTGIIGWISIAAIVALAVAVFGLYKQLSEAQAQLLASTTRIAQLEHTLSATDEEMDLSAGAMQAKLATLTERTDELWSQMDKLWGSAWRRNQSEIKQLKSQLDSATKSQSGINVKVNTLSQSQTEMGLKLSLLEEQQQSAENLKSQITALKSTVDELNTQSQSRDTKQIEIGSSLAQLEMTQAAISEKLEQLSLRLTSTNSNQTQQKTD